MQGHPDPCPSVQEYWSNNNYGDYEHLALNDLLKASYGFIGHLASQEGVSTAPTQ